jgi:glutamate dehydrogenase/leucine dehydrogenase
MYAEAQLNKVDGWESVVNITNAKEGKQWTQFATDCGVVATPTLVALIGGVVVAKVEGSNNMTSDFWRATVEKHGNV